MLVSKRPRGYHNKILPQSRCRRDGTITLGPSLSDPARRFCYPGRQNSSGQQRQSPAIQATESRRALLARKRPRGCHNSILLVRRGRRNEIRARGPVLGNPARQRHYPVMTDAATCIWTAAVKPSNPNHKSRRALLVRKRPRGGTISSYSKVGVDATQGPVLSDPARRRCNPGQNRCGKLYRDSGCRAQQSRR